MYLYRRRQVYHFRIRIPLDLLPYLPYPELVKSLRTKDPKLAQISVTPIAKKVEEVFTLLRAELIDKIQAEKRLDVILQRRRSREVHDSAKVDAVILSTAIKQFIEDRRHGWGPKTKLENEGSYRLILDIVGDLIVNQIDRNMARTLRDTLLRIPPNVYKVFPELPLQEVLERNDIAGMSITSVNKHISRFSTLLKFCRDEYGLEENPAVGLSLRQKRRADEERKAYSTDDIGKMLSALPDTGSKPERYWVPVIGLYSGLRLDEIAQLYVSDVQEIDGVLCFNINTDGDKKVKTLSSTRVVPIHPRLQELGLTEYVADLRKKGQPRLWMNLNRRDADGYGNAIGKWFQRFNRQYVTDDPQKSFHSLRHAFADRLKQAGIQESLIAELLGHVNTSITTGRYGKRFQPKVLFEALLVVRY